MKRTIILMASLLLCLAAGAQDNLAALSKALEANDLCFDYAFSMKQGELIMKGEGKVILRGQSYIAEGHGLKIISDGRSRWIIDEASKEVVIEENDMVSVMESVSISWIRLSGLMVPSKVKVSLDESTTEFTASNHRLVPRGGEPFTFDHKSLPKDWIVSDMR